MTQLIDRRQNAGKKSTVNRQRFLRRYKSQIKRAVSEAVGKRSITEMDQSEQITIPAKDISEPQFNRGPGGTIERVLPGNDTFIRGDRVKRPSSESGDGGGSSRRSTSCSPAARGGASSPRLPSRPPLGNRGMENVARCSTSTTAPARCSRRRPGCGCARPAAWR